MRYKKPLRKYLNLSLIENMLAIIAMADVMAMMIISSVDVFGRQLLNSPLRGSVELQAISMGIIVFLSLPSSQRMDVHVGMDLIPGRLKGKSLRNLNFFNLAIPFIIFLIITYSSWKAAMYAFETHRISTGVLFVPMAPFLFMVPIGAFLLCMRFIIQLIHLFTEPNVVVPSTGAIKKEI